jgi:hypothetical protein
MWKTNGEVMGQGISHAVLTFQEASGELSVSQDFSRRGIFSKTLYELSSLVESPIACVTTL